MKLTKLVVENYRCFSRLSLELHPQMTVLVAPNGQGKSTLLDAIKVALWPYVRGYDLGSTTNDITGIHVDDVRLQPKQAHQMEPCLPSRITALGVIDSEELEWYRWRESIKKGTKTRDDKGTAALEKVAQHHEFGVFFDQLAQIERPFSLPILAYYGTGRLWSHKKLTASFQKAESAEYSRTYAYRDCLDPASNYKQVAEWYTRIFRSYREEQIRNLERGLASTEVKAELMVPVQSVQKAVNAILEHHTGWKNLAYSAEFSDLALEHPDYGQLKVSQLSDGIRNMVALVADIAYRCVKLNPHLGSEAISQTSGIVLIDEVDMHLHPAWQQTILPDLLKAFPAIQFIVTTHSPQVLSTVRRENIRLIGPDASGRMVASEPLAHSYGEPSGDVLQGVMLVDPQPPVAEKADLLRLTELVDQGGYDAPDALRLMQELLATLGEQHPQLQRLQRSIQRQKALKG